MIEVRVTRVVVLNNDFVVLLRAAGDKRVLPINVDPGQAHSIQLQLQGEEFPRPLTHDLFRNVLNELDCRLARVEICDLREHTFYARLILLSGEAEKEVDARPSDAIALALRCSVPIRVAETVMDAAGVVIAGKHDGTQPGGSLEVLEEKLRQAIEEERYEDAAKIRDEIQGLKETKKSN